MSEFSETPMVEESGAAYGTDLSDDILTALQMGDEESSEEELTPDGETYPDEEEGEQESEDESFDDETEEEENDGDNDEEEESEEDEAGEEVQSAVDGLQKQADACGAFLAAKGLDYNAIREQYLEDGKLSRANIEALEKAGISADLVNGYIEGQQARFEVYAQHVKEIAGGEKEYAALTKWAAKNLSEKEIKHFNKAVDSNDVDEARYAVKGLMALREQAKGTKPQLVHGKTARPKAAVKGFRSLAEQARAQADPRYEIDPEYTKAVDRRILASMY